MTSNIQQASVSKDFRRVYIMNLKAEPAGKWFCLFCAGSDERRHIMNNAGERRKHGTD